MSAAPASQSQALKTPDGDMKFLLPTGGIPFRTAMETDPNSNVGHKGRFYLTKHIWVPQEPIENLNLKMSDMILRRMPKLPLGGEDAIRAFPVLAELKKSHDKIKADLQYLLSHSRPRLAHLPAQDLGP